MTRDTAGDKSIVFIEEKHLACVGGLIHDRGCKLYRLTFVIEKCINAVLACFTWG